MSKDDDYTFDADAMNMVSRSIETLEREAWERATASAMEDGRKTVSLVDAYTGLYLTLRENARMMLDSFDRSVREAGEE